MTAHVQILAIKKTTYQAYPIPSATEVSTNSGCATTV